MARVSLELIECDAENKHIEDIHETSCGRVEKLPIFAFLRLYHELDTQVKFNLL